MSQVISTDCISDIEGADNVFKMEPESEIDEVIKLEESEDPATKVDSCGSGSFSNDEPEVFSIAKIENIDYDLQHTGEKRYECDVCEKSFADQYRLTRHKLSHTGEKPYECDICDNSYRHFHGLNIHKRTHTGEKPYECDVCKKCFSDRRSLTRHKVTLTGEDHMNVMFAFKMY